LRNFSLTCQSSAGAHQLNITEWGESDNPNVLICVHGLTRSGRDFDALACALADNYRVLCPDIVGRGQSDWLENKLDYNYPQYVSDMVRLVAKSGAKSIDWVGTSMGGIVGMLLAAQPHSPIRRLVINDVGPVIPKSSLARIAKYMNPLASPVFASLAAAVATVRAVSPFGPLTDDQWLTTTLPLLKPIDNGQYIFRYDPAIALSFTQQPILDVDLTPFWNEIRCPILVTRGAESDLLLPDTYAAMLKKPNVSGIELANTGHAPMFQDAASIAAVREFLLY